MRSMLNLASRLILSVSLTLMVIAGLAQAKDPTSGDVIGPEAIGVVSCGGGGGCPTATCGWFSPGNCTWEFVFPYLYPLYGTPYWSCDCV